MSLSTTYNSLPEAKEPDPGLITKKGEKLSKEKEASAKLAAEVKALDARLSELKAEQETLNKMVWAHS